MKVGIKIVPNDSNTVCKAIIVNNEGQVLFLKRSEYSKKYANELDLPGGHVKLGEKREIGLLREVFEETGIRIESFSFFREHKNKFFYIIKPHEYKNSNIKLSHEHTDFVFLDVSNLDIKNKFMKIVLEAHKLGKISK